MPRQGTAHWTRVLKKTYLFFLFLFFLSRPLKSTLRLRGPQRRPSLTVHRETRNWRQLVPAQKLMHYNHYQTSMKHSTVLEILETLPKTNCQAAPASLEKARVLPASAAASVPNVFNNSPFPTHLLKPCQLSNTWKVIFQWKQMLVHKREVVAGSETVAVWLQTQRQPSTF